MAQAELGLAALMLQSAGRVAALEVVVPVHLLQTCRQPAGRSSCLPYGCAHKMAARSPVTQLYGVDQGCATERIKARGSGYCFHHVQVCRSKAGRLHVITAHRTLA